MKVSETAMFCWRSFVKIKVIVSLVVYLTGLQPTSFDILPPGLMGNCIPEFTKQQSIKGPIEDQENLVLF